MHLLQSNRTATRRDETRYGARAALSNSLSAHPRRCKCQCARIYVRVYVQTHSCASKRCTAPGTEPDALEKNRVWCAVGGDASARARRVGRRTECAAGLSAVRAARERGPQREHIHMGGASCVVVMCSDVGGYHDWRILVIKPPIKIALKLYNLRPSLNIMLYS